MTTMDQNTTDYLLPYPSGIMRWILRLPLYMYRLGLGGLISWMPFVVVTTRGRRSGKPRYAFLEYRRHGSKYYIVSGWGKQPDWIKNILAYPYVTLRRGNRTYSAYASIVEDDAESLRALYRFRLRSPLYGFLMARVASLDRSTVVNYRNLPDITEDFTIVRLELRDELPRLPALPNDRMWLTQVAGFSLALWALRAVLRSRNSQEDED